jgi:hypothetical protein
MGERPETRALRREVTPDRTHGATAGGRLDYALTRNLQAS